MSKSSFLQLFKLQTDVLPKMNVDCSEDDVKFGSSGNFKFEKDVILRQVFRVTLTLVLSFQTWIPIIPISINNIVMRLLFWRERLWLKQKVDQIVILN